MGWLEDFCEYGKNGEAPEKVIWWVGVATLAGALQRKVWIDQVNFQWTPNFYLLIVGPPGVVKKSTSIGVGMKLLKKVPGIDFGPQVVTWQQLITHMADSTQTAMVDGEEFRHSSCTFSLSEFGSFFDPKNRDMVDNLTDMWDGKLETFRKETKTSGNDDVENPWINMIACTTPTWIADNFSSSLIGSGFGSRPVYVYADRPRAYIAYPSRGMRYDKVAHKALEEDLVERLRVIAEYAGEYKLTEEAYVWGEKWYAEFMDSQQRMGNTPEAGVAVRKQTHLHKLAMVISASRGDFPTIDADHLQEAHEKLKELERDAEQIFGFVGQSPVTSATRQIIETVRRTPMYKSALYNAFSRTLDIVEFERALSGALASRKIMESGDLTDPILEIRK